MQTVVEKKNESDIRSFSSNKVIESVSDNRYTARLVSTPEELKAVLRLRYDVFKCELSDDRTSSVERIDLDEYDLQCEHLIVYENETKRAVGTYRLNTIESAIDSNGFYASSEFSIEDLPKGILDQSVELGRACIAKDHRNSRVLFMLWKGLANYLRLTKKRYLFGCCSIFEQDGNVAGNVLHQLKTDGHLHDSILVRPRKDKACIPADFKPGKQETIDLPALVKIYLRIGAKICGEPAIDREFKTIDYFVVFDLETISKKYLKMFFGEENPLLEISS